MKSIFLPKGKSLPINLNRISWKLVLSTLTVGTGFEEVGLPINLNRISWKQVVTAFQENEPNGSLPINLNRISWKLSLPVTYRNEC